MSENFTQHFENIFINQNSKDMVAINTNKIYDSCAAKDYLENLHCYFTESDQNIVEHSQGVKIKNTSVLYVMLEIEPIAFRKGFFSVDSTFFFEVKLDMSTGITIPPTTIKSLCIFFKKTILFGSDGEIKVFSSNFNNNGLEINNSKNLPKAVVQVANPLSLSAKLHNNLCGNTHEKIQHIPESVTKHFNGSFVCGNFSKFVTATIGLFTITHVERNTQMLVVSDDFGRPNNECYNATSSEEFFTCIQFPTNEFFPPQVPKFNTKKDRVVSNKNIIKNNKMCRCRKLF